MRKLCVVILALLCCSATVLGQDRKLDNLERLYDQGHYGKVIRKSKKLLRDTSYQNHPLPYMWLAINTLERDLSRGKSLDKGLQSSSNDFRVFLSKPNAQYYVETYNNEILNYKEIWLNQIAEYRETGNNKANTLYDLYESIFQDGIAFEDIEKEEVPEETIPENTATDIRSKVISEAKIHLGTPYQWGGTGESGFDCSGYTSYVMAKNGIQLSRMAGEQSKEVKKVNQKKAQPGDLVFFGSGNRVTHVGIVMSQPGEELTMIHASSSKGIMISNIETSSYWKSRLLFTGSVID